MYYLEVYFCALFILLQCSLGITEVLEEGAECRSSGICTRVKNCPPAIESLKKTHDPGFRRCGFAGKDELVCCPPITRGPSEDDVFTSSEDDPNTNDLQHRFIKRKCEHACEEITNAVSPRLDFHIIGGELAETGEFPHMAALGYKSEEAEDGISWDCGASIISQRFLITAAHCIVKRVVPTVARLGATKLNDTFSQDFPVRNTTIFPKYNPLSKHHDIALVEVAKQIKYTEKIYPACLYVGNDDPLGLIVTGWGKTSIAQQDDRSNSLLKAVLVPTPVNKCNISYFTRTSGSKTILPTQICAGSNKSDTCMGDSGGPLQIENKGGTYSIVGITSYGASCGGKIAGVYTRVSRYLEWIEQIVWP